MERGTEGKAVPEVPDELLKVQRWFGGIIERPLTFEGGIQPLTPRCAPIEEEAKIFISASATLEPHERVEIYNQQYWYRLLNALQESYPTLCALMGYRDFNLEIAEPYLCKYRPNSWTLNDLGDRLVIWMEKFYDGSDRETLLLATKIDWAYDQAFVDGELPALQREIDLSTPLMLQPYVKLIVGHRNLLPHRRELIEVDPEHWESHDHPSIERGTFFWAIFRNMHNQCEYKELAEGEFQLLKDIQSGLTLGEAIENLPEETGEELAYWVQEWVLRGWLAALDEEPQECS